MSQLWHDPDDNDDAKAIAIPRVFSENNQANNWVMLCGNGLKVCRKVSIQVDFLRDPAF